MLKDRTIINNTKEEISDMSKHLSPEKLYVCYYSFITNTKGKIHEMSRRCIICNKLTVAYCDHCNRGYCYSTCTLNYGRICLIDYIKIIKRAKSLRRT